MFLFANNHIVDWSEAACVLGCVVLLLFSCSHLTSCLQRVTTDLQYSKRPPAYTTRVSEPFLSLCPMISSSLLGYISLSDFAQILPSPCDHDVQLQLMKSGNITLGRTFDILVSFRVRGSILLNEFCMHVRLSVTEATGL